MLTAYPSDQYRCHRVHGNGRGAGCRTLLLYIIHTSSRWLSVPIAYTRCASEAREPPLASRRSTDPGANHADPKIASLQRFSSEVSIQDHMLQDRGDIYSNDDHQDCQTTTAKYAPTPTVVVSRTTTVTITKDASTIITKSTTIGSTQTVTGDECDHNRHVSLPHISLPPLPSPQAHPTPPSPPSPKTPK